MDSPGVPPLFKGHFMQNQRKTADRPPCVNCLRTSGSVRFPSSLSKLCETCRGSGLRWCTLCKEAGRVEEFDKRGNIHLACSAKNGRAVRSNRRKNGQSGVYVISLDGEPIYVGQANDLVFRKKEHFGQTSGNSSKQVYTLAFLLGSRVTFSSIPVERSRLNEVERRLIKGLTPRLNKTLNKAHFRPFTRDEVLALVSSPPGG